MTKSTGNCEFGYIWLHQDQLLAIDKEKASLNKYKSLHIFSFDTKVTRSVITQKSQGGVVALTPFHLELLLNGCKFLKQTKQKYKLI